jgi:hypothetical protein
VPGDADLEPGLRALGGDTYAVELRFVSPGGEAEAQLLGPPPPRVYVDLAALPAPGPGVDPAACGAALSERLFADPRLRQGLAVARAAAAGAGVPLRVCLRLDAGAPRLHALAWETLPGGLRYALFGGLAFGGYACLSHAAQRLVLWRAGNPAS